jgi:MSHA type pilus biogenesis protein MshL
MLILLVLGGCAPHPSEKVVNIFPAPKPPVQPPQFKPIMKRPSPFEGKFVTLTVKDSSAQEVLYALAQDAGLNLVFDRDVDIRNSKITVAFHKMPLEDALNNVLESLGLFYKIKRNSLFISAFEDRIFNLGFLATIRESKFNVGGDVLGGTGGGEEVSNPLQGNYQISGKTESKTTDIYSQVEATVKSLLSKEGTYSLNRPTGILVVRDRRANMDRIAAYIEDLRTMSRKQVLLKARIIEVNLNKDSSYGIDWSQLNRKVGNYTVSATQNLALENAFLTATIAGGHFSSIINFLETFGKVKVLSNPRIRAITGQSSMISVGRSVSYIKKLEITTETTQGGTSITSPTVEISSIFDGILLGVTPYVSEDGTITMSIVPIKSDLTALEEKQVGENTYTLPQVNLREASTVVRARSGDLIVLGGLIGAIKGKEEKRVPGVSKIPVAGALFKQQRNYSQTVELVILIKPILIEE